MQLIHVRCLILNGWNTDRKVYRNGKSYVIWPHPIQMYMYREKLQQKL